MWYIENSILNNGEKMKIIIHGPIKRQKVINVIIPGINRALEDDNHFISNFARDVFKKTNITTSSFSFFGNLNSEEGVEFMTNYPFLFSSSNQTKITADSINFLVDKIRPKIINLISFSYGAVSHINFINSYNGKIKINNIFISPVIFSLFKTIWFEKNFRNGWGGEEIYEDYKNNATLWIKPKFRKKTKIISGINDINIYKREVDFFSHLNSITTIKLGGGHTFNANYADNDKPNEIWENFLNVLTKNIIN